jgi:Fe-S cluster assembly protein SufB
MHNKKEIKFINHLENKKYKYGFYTNIERRQFPKGLNKLIIRLISNKKKEPIFLKKFRLDSYATWINMKFPRWSNLELKDIDFNNIIYYSIPKEINLKNSLIKVNPKITKAFNKLGVFFKSTKKQKKVAVDAIFDSISILSTYKQKLAKHGVIFGSITEASLFFPSLVEKFLGSVVSFNDNFFAALNSAAFSDGSFCYVPQNTACPIDLSTQFRINDKASGQLERTLIIAEKNAKLNYLEGCTASEFNVTQLHTAIVELIAFENAEINYSTVQNWYGGNKEGFGGIYNFVTKRGLCLGRHSKISWVQVEVGSSAT